MPRRDASSPRPPEEWKSGDEPMTEAQAAYLRRLSEDAGEEFDANLSKGAASRRIDELRSRPADGRPGRRVSRGRSTPARPRDESRVAGEGPMGPGQAGHSQEAPGGAGREVDPADPKDR